MRPGRSRIAPRDWRETADGRRRRPLWRFLAMSLMAHLCLLAGPPQPPLMVPHRYPGQPVLDIQLQDRAHSPALSKAAIRSAPADNASEARAVAPTAKSAAPPLPSAAGGAPGEPAASGTEAGLRNHLLGELQTRLSHYLTYPPLARRHGWEGTVLLGLRVESDGHLEEIRIERSSGYAVLDHSALNSLHRFGRITDVPAWLNGRGVDMQLPVIYRLVEN